MAAPGVVSAMSGVTNALIEAADLAVKRNLDGALAQIDMIRKKHIEAVQGLFSKEGAEALLADLNKLLAEIDSVLRGINYLGELVQAFNPLMPYLPWASFCHPASWPSMPKIRA